MSPHSPHTNGNSETMSERRADDPIVRAMTNEELVRAMRYEDGAYREPCDFYDLAEEAAFRLSMLQSWNPDMSAAPRDGTLIRVKGGEGPYGITKWEGIAKWGLPMNWHRSSATWMTEKGAVLWQAGYRPNHWQHLPPPPQEQTQ